MIRKLDDFDIKILDLLQHDATATMAELSEKTGLSANACWRRIRLLEADGVIKNRVTLLDPQKIGLGITVFVCIRCAEHSQDWLDNFLQIVNESPEVIEFYRLAGDIDYLLKLQVASISEYDRLYKKLVSRVKLTDVSAIFSMEELKHSTILPLPETSDKAERKA
ncbi:glutamate uptake regulatory protein [Zymomonas mobilis subsp. mobilis ZM4 = ATCC 31821]|uniref:Glutamate uptake regulatory protein n=1 Tax=Zymomonas mobilis subsp. mobilis (strain ATCC 31821 / ZM4 / CP4) TaxID=264203 RepID=GRP_ZYMMO|nr:MULTISPECIES: Lrp/AsnC family transcriptional regulator [Zymomonas]P0DJA5.1 RecName: Full=Glutamate uptake regulatory protein [Zymomonas mobilis subsp. mobilis ZM4 = ATCC 31821]AAV89081.1 transcriptional regulator, AsnC family [Zymomonas mobilis subsp. mobilis ZM4 = ATCC 31821]ACV75340.1 transcriptional regulator, AsnC family [Zymomonas mobilis subsp. mobilis NCIMB 11163]AFN56698.1 transcriptional regulator, AsnC family [Zymomonas mobilis subsp. mobilis ATCC 29191]AHB10126.1 transcriptional